MVRRGQRRVRMGWFGERLTKGHQVTDGRNWFCTEAGRRFTREQRCAVCCQKLEERTLDIFTIKSNNVRGDNATGDNVRGEG